MIASSDGILTQRIDQLAEALTQEAALLDELRTILGHQRAAIASHDHVPIESSIQAMGRTILTLEEARRRRQNVISLMTDGRDVDLDSLEHHVGGPLPAALGTAREAVRRSAAAAVRDLAVNHHVLNRVVQAGDAFLQRLFSTAADAKPSYGPGVTTRNPGAYDAVLVNKTL